MRQFINLWFRKEPKWQFTNIDIFESIVKLEPQYEGTRDNEIDIGIRFKGGQWYEAKALRSELIELGIVL